MMQLEYPNLLNPNVSKYLRSKRETNCEELLRKTKKELEILNDSLEKRKKFNEKQITDKEKDSCENACEYECSKLDCPKVSCPELTKDKESCVAPIACPKGCRARWLLLPFKKAKKFVQAKTFYLHREFIGEGALRRGLFEYSSKIEIRENTLEVFRHLSEGNISKRMLEDMLEILENFNEDIQPNPGQAIMTYSEIANVIDKMFKKQLIIQSGIKSIYGWLLPPKSVHCKQLGYKELRNDATLISRYANATKTLKANKEPKGSCNCSKVCKREVDDCNFSCRLGAREDCGQYLCVCTRIDIPSLPRIEPLMASSV